MPQPVPEKSAADPAANTLLAAAIRRARWTIFWERLCPALATLATAIGVFLSLSWLGLWLWLPPLGRAAAFAVLALMTLASIIPFAGLRIPALRDGLRRLDRDSGLSHRPATTIADELAVTSKDPFSLALWNAHLERARQAARALKARAPSPRPTPDATAARSGVSSGCARPESLHRPRHWKDRRTERASREAPWPRRHLGRRVPDD